MRDLMICLTVAMVLGGAVSTGRHYLAGQDYRHDSRAVELPARSTPQRLATTGYQPETWADFEAELANDEPPIVVATKEQALKADAQPALVADTLMAKSQPQPPIDTNPLLIHTAQPKPEKPMVGPDGVVFLRSDSTRHQGVDVVKETKPLAPALGMPEQARVMAVVVLADEPATPSIPTPEPEKTGDVVVTHTNSVKQSPPHTQTKSAGLMVGPDGVVFRPVAASQPALPR
jgi:hypothetical protein